jgi:RNA polymerase sigma-70 factor (ECF subfamily)
MPKTSAKLQREFLDLVEAHQGIVFKVCALYAADESERQDLHQEILMQLWRSFPSFRGDSRFSTWMYRVALNTALLARRRQHSKPRWEPLPELESASPDPPGTDLDAKHLQRCIRRLPKLDRAVILLYLEQHKHEEIAELTGLSRQAVGVRIVRIKKRLRECLLTPNLKRG